MAGIFMPIGSLQRYRGQVSSLSRRVVGLWTPSQISTAVWLDAADASTITQSAGLVSQWMDKSGNNRHVSQATGSLQPSYSVAGLSARPTIDWGAATNDKSLTATGLSPFSPVRYYGVADWDGPAPFNNYVGLISHNYGSNADLFITESSGSSWFAANPAFLNGASTSSNTALPTILAPFIFGTDFSQTGGKTELYIGNDRGIATRGWRGKISEIIALPAIPSLIDKQRIEGYLAWKWGLVASLPANHPYKTAAP